MIKEQVVAGDASIIEEGLIWASLVNGGDVNGLQAVREVGMRDHVIC